MALKFALDELHATGWSGLDSAGCAYDTDGRMFPTPSRVRQEFAAAGFDLDLARVDRFNCYRAEWKPTPRVEGEPGAVVSATQEEAGVYALAQLRRSLVAAGV